MPLNSLKALGSVLCTRRVDQDCSSGMFYGIPEEAKMNSTLLSQEFLQPCRLRPLRKLRYLILNPPDFLLVIREMPAGGPSPPGAFHPSNSLSGKCYLPQAFSWGDRLPMLVRFSQCLPLSSGTQGQGPTGPAPTGPAPASQMRHPWKFPAPAPAPAPTLPTCRSCLEVLCVLTGKLWDVPLLFSCFSGGSSPPATLAQARCPQNWGG